MQLNRAEPLTLAARHMDYKHLIYREHREVHLLLITERNCGRPCSTVWAHIIVFNAFIFRHRFITLVYK